MNQKKKGPFKTQELLASAYWHWQQGHKLIAKSSPDKAAMPDAWQKTKGMDWPDLEHAIKENGCQSVAWVLEGSGCVVVDVDNHDNREGDKSKTKLSELGLLPKTRTVITGGGGYHHIYKLGPKDPAPRRKIEGFPSIDFMSTGYVVIEGSLHELGEKVYQLADGSPTTFTAFPLELVRLGEKKAAAKMVEDGVLLDFCTEEDVLRAISILRETDPPEHNEDWVRMVFAALNVSHHTGMIPLMTSALHDWSAKDEEKYDPAARKRIDNMAEEVERAGPQNKSAGLGTLIRWAQLADAPPKVDGQEEKQQRQTDNCGFNVYRADEDEEFTPPVELVQSLFTESSVGMILANYNTGKSALALDLAVHIASGEPWNGLLVQKRPVFYFAIEGLNSIRSRFQAYKEAWVDKSNLVFIGPEGIDLTLAADRKKIRKRLFKLMRQLDLTPGLLIIDTLAEATPGVDENTPAIGAIGAWAKSLGATLNAMTLIVHHVPKGGNTSRGHTSLPAVMDTIINLEEDPSCGEITGTVSKQRDLLSKQMTFTYRINSYPIPNKFTNFGDPLTTARIEILSNLDYHSPAPKKDGLIEELREAILSDSEKWKGMSIDKAKEALTGAHRASRATLNRAKQALIDDGFLLDVSGKATKAEKTGFYINPDREAGE